MKQAVLRKYAEPAQTQHRVAQGRVINDNSLAAIGQRKRMEMLANSEKSATQQPNSALQRVEDEEPLQGKLEAAQRVEEEELLQGKFATLQRVVEEEPLQGKFETAQRVEEEEPLQGKFAGVQPMEEEEPLQAKSTQAASTQLAEKASAKPNNTGLTEQLKSGIESLSGMSMDHVKVHYNSSQPTQLNAHAYAQGSDIHVAPGQEKHLPHEAWHVVQQAQGRVKPTMQMKAGVPVNDDRVLETEADVMGAKALQRVATHESHPAPIGQLKPNASTVLQKYTPVELDSSQTWEQIRAAFPVMRPTLVQKGLVGSEHFEMQYIEGTPNVSALNVSDATAQVAMNADAGAQQKSFFVGAATLQTSNQELLAANSNFVLAPTGVQVTVNNFPNVGVRHVLSQVVAKPSGDKSEEWAKNLETRCNVYYKNITKAHSGFVEITKTTKSEGLTGAIPQEHARQIDSALAEMQLKAGDAFEIKAEGEQTGQMGWNEHYAGIVAVDGGDQVTLENYNRDAEFGDQVIKEAIRLLGKSGQQIDSELSNLRKELKGKWFWESKEIGELNRQIQQVELQRQQWANIMKKSKRQDAASHHFNLYGPASKGQSFLDKWRSEMETKQSKLSVAKSN